MEKAIPDPVISEALAQDERLLHFLQSFITENKKMRMEQVLRQRTRYIVVVLENVIDEHNVEAVVRSCECTGVQDVYIITEGKGFKPARGILRGADKWTTLIRYQDNGGQATLSCLQHLRQRGYQIVVTLAEGPACSPEELPMDKPLAICFGQEKTGISRLLYDHADTFLKIPMTGFTESFNVSVAAGIILYTLTRLLRHSTVNWQLTEAEKRYLRFEWTWKCLQQPDLLVKEFYSRHSPGMGSSV
jgi:tRNA (guanosine-2'-O-)-methyltransferase